MSETSKALHAEMDRNIQLQEEIEKLRKHLDAIIAFKNKHFVSVEKVEKIIKQRPCKSCKYFSNWLKELKNQVARK